METVKNPNGTPIHDLHVGMEVNGAVATIVPQFGIWFDIGAVKYGMMPKRLFRNDMPDFQVGDIVEGLHIETVDTANQRFTVSGEGLDFGEPIILAEGEVYEPGMHVP